MSKPPSPATEPNPARDVAATVLTRVWSDKAFASAALDAELSRRKLSGRDAALSTELVYGVLRYLGLLEKEIARFATNTGYRKKSHVRAHMCLAVYSIILLDRIPAFAAVSQAVDAIKRSSDKRVAGFANAVLRRIAKDHENAPPLDRAEALLQATPRWLRRALERPLGKQGAADFLQAGPTPAPMGICLEQEEDREKWKQRIEASAPRATIALGTVSPRALVLSNTGDPRQLPGAAEAWRMQEEGAQVVGLLAGGRPGQHVLDACSGRGGKAFLMKDAVGPEGLVEAADLHPRKLQKLEEADLRKRIHRCFAVDWMLGQGQAYNAYDLALVDAPCTGSGTLRRRPELVSRLQPSDPKRMAETQLAITRSVARCVRDGGRLVYAVCSILPPECEGVVQALQQEHDGVTLKPVAFESSLAAQLAPEQHTVRLLPHVHGTDGYFIASFRVHRTR